MRVLVTGATGLIGRELVRRLREDGHEVIAWVRDAARARRLLGDAVERALVADGDAALSGALLRSDAVVNLAGEPLMGGRWTAERKRALRESRVDVTKRLVAALEPLERRPRVFVSGSAVGYYGDRGDTWLSEDSPPGSGFLADLCRDWEAAAAPAERLGARVVVLRTGVVLAREGGALAEMLPPFRAGLGGPLGTGEQYVPWVHRRDLTALIVHALGDERCRGPLLGCAPAPVTSRELAQAIGRTLGRPARVRVPAFALRLRFGEAADAVLTSQRARSARTDALGFRPEFAGIDAALQDLLGAQAPRAARPSHA